MAPSGDVGVCLARCFPVTQGLSGAAVASGETVVVGDVSKDPRYLTAFGSTRSEGCWPSRWWVRCRGHCPGL